MTTTTAQSTAWRIDILTPQLTEQNHRNQLLAASSCCSLLEFPYLTLIKTTHPLKARIKARHSTGKDSHIGHPYGWVCLVERLLRSPRQQ